MCLSEKPSVALQHNTTKKAVPNALANGKENSICYQRKPIKSQNPSVSISAFFSGGVNFFRHLSKGDLCKGQNWS